MLKPCLMTTTGESMRMIMSECLGKGIVLDEFEPNESYWDSHRILTPEIVENTGEFPAYRIRTPIGDRLESCH